MDQWKEARGFPGAAAEANTLLSPDQAQFSCADQGLETERLAAFCLLTPAPHHTHSLLVSAPATQSPWKWNPAELGEGKVWRAVRLSSCLFVCDRRRRRTGQTAGMCRLFLPFSSPEYSSIPGSQQLVSLLPSQASCS